ncbi:MAG: hypothetical protein ACTS80_00900 [Candidatus Hodgkinia cicadicola]
MAFSRRKRKLRVWIGPSGSTLKSEVMWEPHCARDARYLRPQWGSCRGWRVQVHFSFEPVEMICDNEVCTLAQTSFRSKCANGRKLRSAGANRSLGYAF